MKRLLLAITAVAPLFAPAAQAQVGTGVDVSTLQPLGGRWSFRTFPGGSEAAFSDASGAQRLIVRCNRSARVVSVVRTAVPAAAPVLAIWTSTTSRGVPSRFDLPSRTLSADIAATDPLLDAVALSRGRFATSAVGAPLVALPAWPEPARVVEECRS